MIIRTIFPLLLSLFHTELPIAFKEVIARTNEEIKFYFVKWIGFWICNDCVFCSLKYSFFGIPKIYNSKFTWKAVKISIWGEFFTFVSRNEPAWTLLKWSFKCSIHGCTFH